MMLARDVVRLRRGSRLQSTLHQPPPRKDWPYWPRTEERALQEIALRPGLGVAIPLSVEFLYTGLWRMLRLALFDAAFAMQFYCLFVVSHVNAV